MLLMSWVEVEENTTNHLDILTKHADLERARGNHVVFTNQGSVIVNKIFQLNIEIFDFISYS